MPVRRKCARLSDSSRLIGMLLLVVAGALPALAEAQTPTASTGTIWSDAFADVDGWEVITAEGVTASIFSDPRGRDGPCLRLEYRFERGAGFCVLRYPLDLALPDNYRVRFDVHGAGPTNNMELKLLDPSLDNVWWINRRAFEWPGDWQRVLNRRRQFGFAWGPSGGAPLTRLGAIEFAVASNSGGGGTVWIDNLVIEEVPQTAPPSRTHRLLGSSRTGGDGPFELEIPAGGAMQWSSSEKDATPTLALDLMTPAEIGGVAVYWAADRFATDYDVQLSSDGRTWETATTVTGGDGGRDYVRLPDAECRAVRIAAKKVSGPGGVTVRGMRALPPETGESANALFEQIARESSPGVYPRYFLGQAQPWTVIGLPNHGMEALIDTDGAVEIGGSGFRVEPLITLNGANINATMAKTTRWLADGCLPLPHVRWEIPELAMEISPVITGTDESPRLLIRYEVTNLDGEESRELSLDLMFRPFQVLPPWQWLNVLGGVGKMTSWEWDGGRAVVNGRWAFTPWVPVQGAGASTWDGGEIVEHLSAGTLPKAQRVDDPRGLASGALRIQGTLPPKGKAEVVLEVSLSPDAAAAPIDPSERDWAGIYAKTRASWIEELGHARLQVPASGRELAQTWIAQLGYILVNADGPAIQPGSRTYERSWIRDGALTCTALLQAGHHERVRAYLDWFAPNQFESGKIPCVVDHRGPDPVDEHDSTGQFLYLLHKYYRHTRDRTMLERNWPRIEKAVGYLETIRAKRMTPEYRDGPPEKKVLYGLLPESISHEGYSAKPMHSYWDDFFALRGLGDAAAIAELLDRKETASRWRQLTDDFRTTLYDSVRLAMETRKVEYIPGCAELGDFDATSTTVAIEPAGELGRAPEPALHNTFQRYLQFFRDRRDGRLEWKDYTPYELRLVGSFVYLGHPEVAHELLDFFFRDRNPPEWRQWAEVVHRDPTAPRFIGDMPHTWVGAGYFVAVRAMFVYERESDGAMVLGAGVRRDWLDDPLGVRIENWSTEYGPLSYTMTATPERTLVELTGDFEMPPGGLVIRSPRGPIRAIRADGAEVSEVNGQEATLRKKAARIEIEN